MSAYSCSRTAAVPPRGMAKRIHWSFVLAAALALAWATNATAARRATAERESLGTVQRISVGAGGIEVTDASGRTSRPSRVRIQTPGIGVNVSSDPDSLDFSGDVDVDVNLPRVRVDVGDEGIVRIFSDAEVARDEIVEGDVVAVMGSVRVEGHVEGDVVAVMGSVTLLPGAAVEGDVVAVGGPLDQAPGATVGGESVSLGFFYPRWGAPTVGMLVSAVLLCAFLSLILGALIQFLFPARLLRIASTVSTRPAASFLLGVVSAPLLVVVILLLLITVIGIPIAILLPFVYVFAAWVGQLGAIYVLGSRVLRKPLGEGPPIMAIAVGTAFVALFFVVGILLARPAGALGTVALFFNLLGALLAIGLWVVGTGAVMVSRCGSRPKDLGLPTGVPTGAAGSPVADPLGPSSPEMAPLPPA